MDARAGPDGPHLTRDNIRAAAKEIRLSPSAVRMIVRSMSRVKSAVITLRKSMAGSSTRKLRRFSCSAPASVTNPPRLKRKPSRISTTTGRMDPREIINPENMRSPDFPSFGG